MRKPSGRRQGGQASPVMGPQEVAPGQLWKVRACVNTGHSSCETTSECCSGRVSFLFSCHCSVSSSGPWAPRPPQPWPLTPAAPPSCLPPPPAWGGLRVCSSQSWRLHKGAFHQRALWGDWAGMWCPPACGHKDPFSLLLHQPLDWLAEGPVWGDSCPSLLKYGRDWGQADNGSDLQSAGAPGPPAGVALISQQHPKSKEPCTAGSGGTCVEPHRGSPGSPAVK